MRKFNNRLQDALAFAKQKGVTVGKRVKGETETSIQVGAVRVFIQHSAPNHSFWMLHGAPFPYRYGVGDAIVKAVRVQVEPGLRRPASEATEACLESAMFNLPPAAREDVQHRIDAFPMLLEALTAMIDLVEQNGCAESLSVYQARLAKARAERGTLPF